MKKITFAEKAISEYGLERKKVELHPLEVYMNNYGTEHLQLVEEGVFDLLKIGVDKLADGFQFTDATAIISMYSPVKQISNNWQKAQLEIKDLDAGEAGANIEFIADNIMQIFGVELEDVGELGIENLEKAIDIIFDIVEIVKTALADGLDLKDVYQVPELMHKLIDFGVIIQVAVKEAGDLNGKEVSEVARHFAEELHKALV